jgi:predicted nucleic acid-binding protein
MKMINGAKVLFDTNILIDYLNEVTQAKATLKQNRGAAICPITWMEVMVGTPKEKERATRAFLGSFRLFPFDDRIYEEAVTLRKKYGMRLPDALVYATARVYKHVLTTRNTKDFSDKEPDITIPYRL